MLRFSLQMVAVQRYFRLFAPPQSVYLCWNATFSNECFHTLFLGAYYYAQNFFSSVLRAPGVAKRTYFAHPFEIVVGEKFFDLIELCTGTGRVIEGTR